MKTRLCVFAAVVLAAFGAHAIGEAWYTPAKWEHDKETAFVTIYDDKGNFVGEGNATVDEDGNVSGLEGITSANEVSCKALQALVLAERNKERIATIGKNLTYLFNTKKATLNKIGSNGIYPVEVGIETTIDPESESEPLKISISEKSPRVDGNTIELNTETKQYQLKNADKQKDTSGSLQKWWVDKGITGTVGSNAVFLPYLSGGTLNWSRYDGCDDSMFANWENLASQKLSLRDFHNTDAYEHTTISRLLTENNDVQHKLRTQLNLVARKASSSPGQASTETLTYIPIGDVLAGLGAPADGVSIEEHIVPGATNLAIKGWHDQEAEEADLVALMSKESPGKNDPKYAALLRRHNPTTGSNEVAYVKLGDIHKMTWSTNWYDSVKDIAEKEAQSIVNWNTNWVRLASDIASSQKATQRYVDNALMWTTNWFASTADMNQSLAKVQEYIDAQLNIITNANEGIKTAIAALPTVNSVKDYVQEVVNIQSNIIIDINRAVSQDVAANTKSFVDNTFDYLTNTLFALEAVKRDAQIGDVKTYVDDTFDWTTNFVANVEKSKEDGIITSTKQYVDDSFLLMADKINAISNVVLRGDSETIASTKDYVNAEIDFLTNVVVAAELATLSDKIGDMNKLVDDTFAFLTNTFIEVENAKLEGKLVGSVEDYAKQSVEIMTEKIDAISNVVVRGDSAAIKSTKDYVDTEMELLTTTVLSALVATNMNENIKSIKDFVLDEFDIITNELYKIIETVRDGNKDKIDTISDYKRIQMDIETETTKAIEAATRLKILAGETNVAKCVSIMMDVETNFVVSVNAATNKTLATYHDLFSSMFEYLTNRVTGIRQVADAKLIPGVTNVTGYVTSLMDVETNTIVAVMQATNILDCTTHEFVEDEFDLSTNRLYGIKNVAKAKIIPGVTNVATYIQALMDIETNVIVAVGNATNNLQCTTHEFVDDNFDLSTNRLYGIRAVAKSGMIENVTNVAGYVRALMDIETNVIVGVAVATNYLSEFNMTSTDFVRESLELYTNKLYAINSIIKNGASELYPIRGVPDYADRELDFSTNFIIKTGKYVPVEMVDWATNLYENMQSVELWNTVSNIVITYFGGLMDNTKDDEGKVPEIPKSDDPYSSEYEHDAGKDAILPVKNALLIKAMTNELFSVANATNVLDCESLYTNDLFRAEIHGFGKASTNQLPVKVRIEADDPDKIDDHEYGIEWMDYPTDLLSITSADIRKVIKWLHERTSETNILSVVATNYETLAAMSTNLFSHVKPETLLDNQSVWTNGERQIEIKGYQVAYPFTVPYIDWGETTNYYNTSHWEDQGHYEEQIDPETGATNQVWISNMVWVYEWSGMATEGKVMKWERYPFADYELSSRYAEGAPLFWSINQGELEKTETGMSEPQIFKYMSIYGFATSDDCAIPWRHEVTSEEDDPATVSNCQAKINWTTKPEDASPTKNYELTMNGTRVAWTPSASAIRFVGNVDPAGTGALAAAVVGEGANTNTVTFASASDSNVKVDVQSDGNGNVTITIGVYYVTESNNPSSGSSGL